jgi:hypothetical protein
MTYEEQFCIFLVPGILDDPNVDDKITTSEKWVGNVRSDLRKIGESRVGVALLRSIKYHGVVITIEPFHPIKMTRAVCGASTRGGQFGPTINYTPEFYGHGTACEEKWIQRGGFVPTRQEILFHELIHGFRKTSGQHQNHVLLGDGLSFYSNFEEFCAVLLQGIYASELRRPIRASLQGTFRMDRYLEGPYLFFQSGSETYDAIAIFCDQNRGFTGMIAKVNVPFNPIRAYYENPEKARKYANSAIAKTRDNIMPIANGVYDFLRGL